MWRGCLCRYATSNTRSGIESCGILAGSLREKQGVFVISTLIIPKQEGTSDTVQALNEEEIFDVQDKRALYPLGWIHTHPTQTCFLSSVDVHTQCGYQVNSRASCHFHATARMRHPSVSAMLTSIVRVACHHADSRALGRF